MLKRIRAENPDYKPIVVGWRLSMAPLPSKGLMEGRVDYFVRSPEGDGRVKRKVSFRCVAGPGRLCISGIGTATESSLDEEGRTRKLDILLREMPGEALQFLRSLRVKIEHALGKLMPIDVSKPLELAGVLKSYPHERGVKWLREYEQVSLESLGEEPLAESAFP